MMRKFSKRWCTGVMLIAVAFICIAGISRDAAAEASEKADTMKPTSVKIDFRSLEGKWVRPDGGYVLELKNIKKDGSMTAAYFNPRPIRVFRAEATKKNDTISLVVELRDVNYPGSTYTLQYDPATDRLRGKYYQAVERQTFNIEFVRVK